MAHSTGKLSEPQQLLVEGLKNGGTLRLEPPRGLYRLTKSGKTRSEHPATVNALLARGLLIKQECGEITLA
ncbi:hypothetical protein [Paracidovorax wautersii]|uniref:Uncharacterized protein n=1 Tax=Paracidovorax wautersii TaxID=1177982 RepID=A0A1I2HY67_9BURK|nr:hypothetical protein [Paracidovorax wautersii]SFF34280.1 hypothetical protein SAMN04489711_1426 [Paracidovorax wautersii]